MIRALARSTAGRLLFAAYAVTAVVCAFVPLADHIGYELAVALTIVAAIFAPAAGVAATRIEMARVTEPRRPARASAIAGAFAVVALILPTAIILLNGLRRPICDPVLGSFWLIVLPAPTAWLSATLGALAALMIRRSGVAIAAVLAIEVGSGIAVALSVYFGPAAFGMDHFAGWFTGFTRGALEIDGALLSFRAATVAWGAALVTLAGAIASPEPAVRRMHRSWAIGLTIALVAISVGWGDGLGWRTSDSSLRRALSSEQTVDGIVVHYDGRLSDRTVDALMRDVAYTGAAVRQALGVTPAHGVHLWVYSTGIQKARLVGGVATQFAKPYRHEAHMIRSAYPQTSLRHELIHVYAAEFAPGPWGAAGGLIPNTALIEGLATAFDVDDEELTLYQQAKAMRELKIAPDIEHMMSARGFAGQGVSRAYAYSGAFVRYLGDRYGLDAVKTIYRTGSLDGVGEPDAIIGDFERMLDSIPSTANELSSAARRHSILPITQRTCAREIYQVTDSALALVGSRRWDDALRMYDRACALQPENPDLVYQKLGLAVRMRPPTIAPILGIANDLLRHPRLDPTLEVLARLRVADSYIRYGDLAGARREIDAASALPAGPETRRATAVRRLSLGDTARLAVVRRFYAIDGASPVAVFENIDAAEQHPDDPVIQYLVARQHFLGGAHESAIRVMERATRAGLPDSLLTQETWRMLAVSYSDRHRCGDASRAAGELARSGGSRADLAVAADWINRCQFAVARGWKPL